MCVEVIHLTDPGEIIAAYRAGQISELGAIGTLVQLGRTVRQARELVAMFPRLVSPATTEDILAVAAQDRLGNP